MSEHISDNDHQHSDSVSWALTGKDAPRHACREGRWSGTQQEPPKGFVIPGKIHCLHKHRPWGYDPMLYA